MYALGEICCRIVLSAIKRFEFITVIAKQSITSRDPDKSLVILYEITSWLNEVIVDRFEMLDVGS
jgi:hypothetical protein